MSALDRPVSGGRGHRPFNLLALAATLTMAGDLYLTHRGGRVWYESEEGRGALFAFTLPVAEDEGAKV